MHRQGVVLSQPVRTAILSYNESPKTVDATDYQAALRAKGPLNITQHGNGPIADPHWI